MNNDPTWMLYGADGYTGSRIAQHACEVGHRPLLAGRSEPALKALAHRLDLPCRIFDLDEPITLSEGLSDVDLVLNVAGPFLHRQPRWLKPVSTRARTTSTSATSSRCSGPSTTSISEPNRRR